MYKVEKLKGRFRQLPAVVTINTLLQKYWDESKLTDGMFCFLIEEQTTNPYTCTYSIVWGGEWQHRKEGHMASLDSDLDELLKIEMAKYDGYVTPYKEGCIEIGERISTPTLQVRSK